MMIGQLIAFFFVDDFIWAFIEKNRGLKEQIVEELKKLFELTMVGDLKWFLGIHVIRDRAKRHIYLT